jgi:hypothetical protein
MKNGRPNDLLPDAEISAIFLRFSAAKLAVGAGVNWYTFEALAGEIRTVRTIYYYYP